MGFISKRSKKSAIIRYPRLNKEKDAERYYANIICLFLPHRQSLKLTESETYESYYCNALFSFCDSTEANVSDVIVTNMSKYEQLKENLEEAWEEMKDISLEDAWGSIAPSTEQEREEVDYNKMLKENFELENEEECIPELSEPSRGYKHNSVSAFHCKFNVSNESIQSKLRSLNERQKEVFNFVRRWCLDKIHNKNPAPFHIFINGGAGTGKSHLIQCLQYESSRILQRNMDNPDDTTVMLVAFTGTAAFNIFGQTVHSSFSIRSTSLPYQHLNEDNLNTMRSKLENVSIVTIDEVSMISKSLLEYISGRLQQIKKHFQSKPFGNVSIISVGDFYQLPPVHGQVLYKVDPGALPVDLWSYFHIFTLTEIMRQKDDQCFASLLNRIRTRAQSENMQESDDNSLQARVVSEDYPINAIHIFATNKKVEQHNLVMLKKVSSDIVTLEAADIVQSKKGKSYRRKSPDPNLQSSLKMSLDLCEGARVMLTMNIDVSDGLVNGVIGTVVKIVLGKQPHGLPECICIKFDDVHVGCNLKTKYQGQKWLPESAVPLSFSTDKVKSSIMEVTRHMYPLVLAWACTIHKVQGKTFSEVVVSMDGIFRAGMANVALSRATNINGLHLLDYNQQYIYADPNVQKALNNMPTLHTTLANPLLNLHKDSFVIVHHNIQSLPAHFQDLIQNKEVHKASVICLTETWLSNKTVDGNYSLPGYTNVCVLPGSSATNKSMGIVCYFQQNCSYEIVHTMSHNTLEIAVFKLDTPFPLLLAVVYKHPSHSHSSLQNIPKQLLKLANEHNTKAVIIMGDFNEDISNPCSPHVMDSFTSNGFSQLVKEPTTLSGTTLDHVYVHSVSDVVTGVLSTYYSYHDPVFINLKPETSDNVPLSTAAEKQAPSKTFVTETTQQPAASNTSVKETLNQTQKSKSKRRLKVVQSKQLLTNPASRKAQKQSMSSPNVNRILGFQSDSLTPPFPLQHPISIPAIVSQQASGKHVRIIDMWSGNAVIHRLSQWLSAVGYNVIETFSNLQVGPSCGYIAVNVAWNLHTSTDWKTQDVHSALDTQHIRNYNMMLNKRSSRPSYLTDNQILTILATLQYNHTGSRTVNWISGPMPLNYLIQSFRNDFNTTRRRTRQQQNVRISIVNTTPVSSVLQNLQDNVVSGDHWIVVASSL